MPDRTMPVAASVPGAAAGPALVLDEPLSLWGGLDPATGEIIDPHHPQRGAIVTGRILVLPASRGSSSASSVLAEAIRLGTAPVAFVLGRADEIIALGCLVGEELYGVVTPVVVAAEVLGDGGAEAAALVTGDLVSIEGQTLRISG